MLDSQTYTGSGISAFLLGEEREEAPRRAGLTPTFIRADGAGGGE